MNTNNSSRYNNLLALPLLLLMFYFNILPHSQLAIDSNVHKKCEAIATVDSWIYFSAFASVIISTSAFSSQKLMTGTAFVTLNNINKIPGILLSNLIFGAVLKLPMIVGLSLSLFSGFLFALFSETTKSISNMAVFQLSLVCFIIVNIVLYSGYKFTDFFRLELIGVYAPAAIKALPALLMSILTIFSTPYTQLFQRPAGYVAIALAFSSCGDFALELPDISQTSESLKSQLFMVGMAFFAVAQWFYITAFSFNNVPLHPKRAIAPFTLVFIALLAMKNGIIREAASDIGLGIGVIVYAMLLGGSTWKASARIGFSPAQTKFNLVMLFKQQIVTVAAVSFMLSDLLIALGKFHSSTGAGGHALVMVLYWLAQALYTVSMFHYETLHDILRIVVALLLMAIVFSSAIAYSLNGHGLLSAPSAFRWQS
jgi:hypothetical protein